MSKFREIRERAIANGMVLLTQDEVLEEIANRRSGRSEKMKQTSLREQFMQRVKATEPEKPKSIEQSPPPEPEKKPTRRGRPRKKILLDDDDD